MPRSLTISATATAILIASAVAHAANVAPIHQCDHLAASPHDADAMVEGVDFEDFDNPGAAIEACRAALEKFPDEVRFLYQLGRALQKNGDVAEGIPFYRRAADAGSALAQNNLGAAYQSGSGVVKDPTQALFWFDKAAQNGLAFAQNNLSRIFAEGAGVPKDPEKAFYWARQSAEQGDARGQYLLGDYYEDGIGVAVDKMKAVELFLRSAEQGHTNAQAWLGYKYENGQDVAKDLVTALKWYRLAARGGNPYSIKALARLAP